MILCYSLWLLSLLFSPKKCLSRASRIVVKLDTKQIVILKRIMQTIIILHSYFVKTFCSMV